MHERRRHHHRTWSSLNAGGVIGSLALAPETAARLTWFTTKSLSFENADPAGALNEALEIFAWCALPSVVGAVVGALVTALVSFALEHSVRDKSKGRPSTERP